MYVFRFKDEAGHTYVIVYSKIEQALKAIRGFANNPDLPLTLKEAKKRIKCLLKKHAEEDAEELSRQFFRY